MHKNTLTFSIVSLVIALLGGVLLVADLWLKNAPAAASASSPLSPTVDGRAAEGEYAHSSYDEITGMTLYWSVVGNTIYFGLHSPGAGWLAMGLAPDGPMMRGADIVMGYIKDGQAFVEDHFGDTPTSHKHDTAITGSDSLISFAGAEDELGSALEWSRSLATGDARDKPLDQGKVFVQLAYADQDDWSTYHSKRNTIPVDFFASEGD